MIETSFTMRDTTKGSLHVHKILRLPRKMSLMIDPSHIWNVIYNARCNKSQPPTSPNTTAPATYNESHDWSASHMKRHLQCAEPVKSPFQLTKYCTCHAKWISALIRLTYETSCTMRGTTSVILQLHQIMRLPRKMTRMIDLAHIWNVICNARSNSAHPPTSPNIAPATQNGIPKYEENLLKTVEASFTKRVRPWSEHEIAKLNPPVRGAYFSPSATHLILYWKLQHFALWLSIQISPNIAPATKSHSPRSPKVVPAANSDTPTSPNIVPPTKSGTATSPNAAPATKSDIAMPPNIVPARKSDRTVTFLNCYFPELLLCWTVALLSCYFTELLHFCYFTELLLYGAVTFLNCYFRKAFTLLHCDFTELLLDWTVTELLLCWVVSILSCYFTELLLYCYFTDLLLYGAVALLNYYFSKAVTLLNCYFTELLLHCSFTELLLYCYFPELLLLNCYFSKAVTLLSCYITELLLDWAVTILNCFFTELLLYWAVTLLISYFTVFKSLYITRKFLT